MIALSFSRLSRWPVIAQTSKELLNYSQVLALVGIDCCWRETPAQAAQLVSNFQMQGIDATCYTKNQTKNGRGILIARLIVFSCLRVSTMHILQYLMTARLKRACTGQPRSNSIRAHMVQYIATCIKYNQ